MHPTGRYYYQNISTGEVSWERPNSFYTMHQLAKLLSHYYTIKKNDQVDFTSMPDGVPFVQPLQPSDSPSV